MEQGKLYELRSYAAIRSLGWQIYRLFFNNNITIDIAAHFDKYIDSHDDDPDPFFQIHVGIINLKKNTYQCHLLGVISRSRKNLRPIFDLLKRHEEIAKIGQICMLVSYNGE